MKSTDQFQETIRNYLEERAKTDVLFAQTYAKPNKNLPDCIAFILNTVKTSGCNGFTDDEIYSLAIHYYDEDDLSVGRRPNVQAIVNHHIELTEEEKYEARKQAIKQYENKAYAALKKKQENKRKASENNSSQQLTLF